MRRLRRQGHSTRDNSHTYAEFSDRYEALKCEICFRTILLPLPLVCERYLSIVGLFAASTQGSSYTEFQFIYMSVYIHSMLLDVFFVTIVSQWFPNFEL